MAFKTYMNAGGGNGPMAPVTSPSGGGSLASAAGAWHPSVLYMIALVAVEIFFVAWISKHL